MVKNSELMKKMMMFTRKTQRGFGGPENEMQPPHHGPGKRHGENNRHGGFFGGMQDGPRERHGAPGKFRPPFKEGGPRFGKEKPSMPPFEQGAPDVKKPMMSREHMLVIIGEYPDGVRQKTIAERLGINQSSASELIVKLESDGYLKRSVDPEDKRATLLFLTDLGYARAAEVEDEREAMFSKYFSVLTEEEKETLSNILDKLLRQPEDNK